ncbi:glycerol-3-phosphate dehydrogenase [Lachnospiraceae bacterium A10]|nr:glycerol-3-phosphate dehydrogenase [Lachnospiraceae bacterium A10]
MYDVAIVGAGVIGSAIARELSKFRVNACVIERETDVCEGTSKANSAIVHAGFDAKPGTLKAKLNVEGNALMEKLSQDLDFPLKKNGSLVVCTKDQDATLLDKLLEQSQLNGVPGCRIIEREELIQMEPNLADDVVKALYAPTGAIVCPFHLTIALAENAADNGVEFKMQTSVESIERVMDHYIIHTDDGDIETKAIVNAAGVYADKLNNMVSSRKLEIIPRRGQYMLLDKAAGEHVSHTIFQLPSKMGKGVLVTPTVHGNLLVGPTAEDIDNKEGVNTTMAGLDSLAPTSSLSVKDVPYRQVITSFAGLRAHEKDGDFVLGEAEDAPNFFNAAGIESPGLSSAPAIGVMIAKEVAEKLGLEENPAFNGKRKGIVNPATLSIEERNALIKENPAYGQIICRCESISEGEILDSIHRTLGARTLDGVKRRTRAGMGRCQAGFCSPKVMEILEREIPMSMFDVRKSGEDSKIVVGYNKKI